MLGRPIFVTALAGIAIAGATSGATASDDDSIQVVAALNKQVVAVGEPFIVDVELYAVLETKAEAYRVRHAFQESGFGELPATLELVRAEPVDIAFPPSRAGSFVTRLTRRFVFRTAAEGRLEVPPALVSIGRTTYQARPRTIHSYWPTAELHAAARSIVPIFAERTDPLTRRRIRRNGTGFFISRDALVTSYHVVADARKVHILLPDGQRLGTDKVWSVDPIRDIVVLHVDPLPVIVAGIKPLALSSLSVDADPFVSVGPAVFTNGWPGGLRRSTAGIRFDGARLGYDRAWVSSNSVGPGDSGGPLLNRMGEVIGVVTLGSMADSSPDVLREDMCIANDPRPAIGSMNVTLGPLEMKSVFRQEGFRQRPYVQAFRLLAMITRAERFDETLRGQLSDFETAMAVRSADPGLHFMRGVLYRMLGTPSEANSSFAQVLDLFEEYFPATYMLGMARLREGRFAEAASFFERTLAAGPYRNLARYGLARTLIHRHEYGRAAALLEEVVLHDPGFAPGLYHLALCRLALGQDDALAIAHARLGLVSRLWQRDLDRVLRTTTLQPKRLQELPRAPMPALSGP